MKTYEATVKVYYNVVIEAKDRNDAYKQLTDKSITEFKLACPIITNINHIKEVEQE